MANPAVGDRFCEMYSYWVYVTARDGDQIEWRDASPPCTYPDDFKIHQGTLADFRNKYAYGAIPGYWISFVDSQKQRDRKDQQRVEELERESATRCSTGR
jgi:hypothetical protein